MKMQLVAINMTPLGEDGKIQTNPVIVPLSLTDDSVRGSQDATETNFVGMCCGEAVTYGAKVANGSFGGLVSSNMEAILLQHIFGKFDTLVNATTESWQSGTVVGKKNLMNHSNGENTLVVTKSGTTGDTEPAVVKVGKRIVDGSANEVAVRTLKKGNITTSKKPRGVAIERTFKKEDGSFFYVRYLGLYFNKTSFEAKSGETQQKWSIDVVNGAVEDSKTDGFVALKDMAGAKTLSLFEDYYTYNEHDSGCIAYRDDVPVSDYDEFSFEVSREIKENKRSFSDDNGTTFCKADANIGEFLKGSGKIKLDATEEDYEKFANNEKFDAKIVQVNGLGGSITTEFREVSPKYSDIIDEACSDAYLDSDLKVTGKCNDGTPSITLEVVYPDFVDTDGNSVVYPI